MSFNVLVIPEDFRKDQHVLKPVVEKMLAEVGRHANVVVCKDPLLGGIVQALRWERLADVIDRYGMVHLFLLVVDRDGDANRRASLDGLEAKARGKLPAGRHFLAESAWQEVEVWLLAGHDLPKDWTWRDVRADANPKEAYFLPFARSRGVENQPNEGRKALALEAARRYDRIRKLCPEDVQALEERIAAL